jgi:hypothetical protein
MVNNFLRNVTMIDRGIVFPADLGEIKNTSRWDEPAGFSGSTGVIVCSRT